MMILYGQLYHLFGCTVPLFTCVDYSTCISDTVQHTDLSHSFFVSTGLREEHELRSDMSRKLKSDPCRDDDTNIPDFKI